MIICASIAHSFQACLALPLAHSCRRIAPRQAGQRSSGGTSWAGLSTSPLLQALHDLISKAIHTWVRTWRRRNSVQSSVGAMEPFSFGCAHIFYLWLQTRAHMHARTTYAHEQDMSAKWWWWNEKEIPVAGVHVHMLVSACLVAYWCRHSCKGVSSAFACCYERAMSIM